MKFATINVSSKIVSAGMVVTLLALLWAGCKDDETGDANFTPIDSRISLVMKEQLGTTGNLLAFHAATEKIYNCANYSLVVQPGVSGQAISVSFSNIAIPSVCLTALGPATADFNFVPLAAGTYTFSIQVNQHLTGAQLVVTDTSYEVINGEAQWTTFPKSYLHRIPSNVIWGYVSYNDPTATGLADEFTDSLVLLGAAIHHYPASDYGLFQVDSAGVVVSPSPPPRNFVKTFIYQYAGDPRILRGLVKRYGIRLHTQATFIVNGSRGEVYNSDVLYNEP